MPVNQVSSMPFYPFLRAVELQGSSGAGARVGVQACLWLQVPSVMYCCCRAVRVVGDLFLVNGGGLL